MRIPFENLFFQLDVSRIAGLFGGEEAYAAMSSVHFVKGRRWLGWYNSPGSYYVAKKYVAKKYGPFARSKVWGGLYHGGNVDPTTMLELDGKDGPRYVAAHSGTRLNTTGHLAYLLMEHCSRSKPTAVALGNSLLTIVTLPESDLKDNISLPTSPFDPIAIIPICYSIGSAVMCAIFRDWYCFAMIMLGVVCNGLSCYVVGSAALEFKPPKSSWYSPPGGGILFSSPGSQVVLLKGPESAVARVTRGRFNLRYASAAMYHDVGFVSLALTTQFLLQLFIVPQGQLSGQIMFLSSLGVSWIFNAYLASIERQDLQNNTLTTSIFEDFRLDTVGLPKWTSLVVFAAISLRANPKDTGAILDEMIPTNTEVWRRVKAVVVKAEGDIFDVKPDSNNLSKQERRLLEDMFEQAKIGYEAAKWYDREQQRKGYPFREESTLLGGGLRRNNVSHCRDLVQVANMARKLNRISHGGRECGGQLLLTRER